MSSSTVPLQALTALVRPELDRVADELLGELRPEAPELAPLVELAAGYRGKQLRPALVFLSGRAVGALNDAHVQVAKVVELLHTATLVHDDVLDGARMRRQVATLNALHGVEIPVLLGDYVYAKAFHLSVALEDPTCSRVLAETTRRICQGEITQILHRFDFDWDEARYFKVIEEKTALLYGSACRLGAHYAGGDAKTCDAFESYGNALGVAFQIVDDCLDLRGNEEVVGKSLGTDLSRGKLTLPLLRMMADGAVAPRLRELMLSDYDDATKLQLLREEFPLDDAIESSLAAAQERIRSACEALAVVDDGEALEALRGVGEYVLSRRL